MYNLSYCYVARSILDDGVDVDILFTDSEDGVISYEAYDRYVMERDLPLPLNDYISDTEISQKLYNSMPENYWEALKTDGIIYAVRPVTLYTEGESYYINKELAEKYGWDIDNPISEQMDIVIKSAENDNAYFIGNVQFMAISAATAFHSFDNIKGIYWDEESQEVKILTDCEESRERIRLALSLNANGVLKDPNTLVEKTFFIYSFGTNSFYNRNGEEVTITDDYFDDLEAIAVVSDNQEVVHQSSGKIGVYTMSSTTVLNIQNIPTRIFFSRRWSRR